MKTFEDIVSGNIPCHKVWEDDQHLAFLNPRPILPGHVIVIPKLVSSYMFDMASEDYHALWEVARLVARQMRERLPCERVCVAVVGWEVRHTHIHLVPTDRSGDFPSLPGREASAEELGKMASRLCPRDAPSARDSSRSAAKPRGAQPGKRNPEARTAEATTPVRFASDLAQRAPTFVGLEE